MLLQKVVGVTWGSMRIKILRSFRGNLFPIENYFTRYLGSLRCNVCSDLICPLLQYEIFRNERSYARLPSSVDRDQEGHNLTTLFYVLMSL
jgi:hypothetical protein